MNFRRTLSLLALFISFLILGGCAAPGRFSPPSYALRIVNNTDAVLSLESGRDLIDMCFLPGETHHFHMWGFRHDQQISFVAKGLAKDKLGVATYIGHPCLSKVLDEVWVIQELIPPTQIAAKKEEKK